MRMRGGVLEGGGPCCRAQGSGTFLKFQLFFQVPSQQACSCPSAWWPQRHLCSLWPCCQMEHLSQRGRQTPGPSVPHMSLVSAVLQGYAKGFAGKTSFTGLPFEREQRGPEKAWGPSS